MIVYVFQSIDNHIKRNLLQAPNVGFGSPLGHIIKQYYAISAICTSLNRNKENLGRRRTGRSEENIQGVRE